MVAPALAAVLVAACFDFGATMAGGPLGDGGTTPPGRREPRRRIHGGLDASADANGVLAESGATESGTDAGPFCASLTRPDGGIFFCDDFDEHQLPGAWNIWAQTSGTLAETDASAVSPPTAIDVTTQAVTNGQVVNVALRTPLAVPTPPATLTFTYSVEPVQIDISAGAAIVLGAVDFLDSAGNRYTVGLAINVSSGQPALALGEQTGVTDGGNLPDGAPPVYVSHPLSVLQPLAMNTWLTVEVEIDWTTTGLEGKVIVNGNPELDAQLTMTVVPTSLQIGVGTSYVTEYATMASPVWEVRYDNVVFSAN